MSKLRLLIVNDDKSYVAFLTESLISSFDVYSTDDLASAERLIKAEKFFHIALVDENIGEESGLEWIKEKSSSCPSIHSFVLRHSFFCEEEFLKCIECGADDCFAKHASIATIRTKLERLANYWTQITKFKAEIANKDRLINISHEQTSKYSIYFQFVCKLNNCFSLTSIRDEVFSFFKLLKLRGCIAFYPVNQPQEYYNSESLVCSPIEETVFEILRSKTKPYRFGNRYIFNSSLVSILIFNLEQFSDHTDVYTGTLAFIVTYIGERMKFIAYRNSLSKVQEQIQQFYGKTRHMLELVDNSEQEVLNDLQDNIGSSFHILDMTQHQEEHLFGLVQSAIANNAQEHLYYREVIQSMDSTIQRIQSLASLSKYK